MEDVRVEADHWRGLRVDYWKEKCEAENRTSVRSCDFVSCDDEQYRKLSSQQRPDLGYQTLRTAMDEKHAMPSQ